MTTPVPAIASAKNQWLYQHIDVKYPTKECLEGRKLYKQRIANMSYKTLAELNWQSSESHPSLEIHKVDFHRLTVMFALMQAKHWPQQAEQDLIVEFLTQIIYSEPCELYLGFVDGNPVAASIVTHLEGQLLLSDFFVEEGVKEPFVASLLALVDGDKIDNSDVYLEI